MHFLSNSYSTILRPPPHAGDAAPSTAPPLSLNLQSLSLPVDVPVVGIRPNLLR